MDYQTKTIFVLLALIAVLTGIFVLKLTGVIKPAERKEEINNSNTIYNFDNAKNNDIDREAIKEQYFSEYNSKNSFIGSFYLMLSSYLIFIRILIFIVNIVINIGIGKLYRKLSMPDWCVYMQYIAPALNITTSIPIIGGLISLIIGILEIVTLAYYFESAEMSKLWAICPIITLLIFAFGVVISLAGVSFWLFIAYMLIILFGIAYIIANIRIADKLNKGTLFKVGIAILPFIFQPILGFMKEDY